MTETIQRRREMLAKTPLFAAIPAALLDELAIKAKTVHVAAREVLFSKGDPGDRLYLVAKGLIVRNPDATDRRRISLVPTSKGEEILAAAPHPAQGHLLVGLERMEREKVEILHESLHTLVAVLEAEKLEVPFFFAKE